MDYIIFDLELNSKPFKNRHPNEIIEIGAVKLNGDLEETGAFQSFVRPKIYRKLFSIVRQKTSITQEDINNAPDFRTVLSGFREWVGKDYILCSWGFDDIHHLKMNCRFHRRGITWINRSFDIQKHFSLINKLPAGQSYSLKNALELMGIEVDGRLHRADADARYTAEIFKRAFDDFDVSNSLNQH